MKIKSIKAREILDSRGNPTIETKVILDDDSVGIASIPSGASIGSYEATELRDNDLSRYGGMGVLKTVDNVNNIIAPSLVGVEASDQIGIDKKLVSLDGTPNKGKLGANAILSVSQGVCEASAAAAKIPTYRYVSSTFGFQKLSVPVPTFNVINGGAHGAGNLDFQEFHIIPSGLYKYSDRLKIGEEVYQAVKKVLIRHNAIHSVGDEGGFAPNLLTNIDAIEVIVQAIKEAGYTLYKDVSLGLDIAADHFYKDGLYNIKDRSSAIDVKELIDYYLELNRQFHLTFIEDPIFENDWVSWQKIKQSMQGTLVIGDDLLASNAQRAREAINKDACSAILIKPNQIGTISETINVISVCRQAGWKIMVSHRSGETNDEFIADLAVGVNADFVKFGAPARGERVAKYNRLLEIEQELTNPQ